MNQYSTQQIQEENLGLVMEEQIQCAIKNAAISSQGQSFYSINNGKTNSLTFVYFLTKLSTILESQDREWRSKTVFLIDNAPYHRSSYIQDIFRKLKYPIFYLGPYQYKLAPVELFFAYVKNRDLNPLLKHQNQRVKIKELMKEIGIQISQLNFKWVKKAFYHVLEYCLQALSLENL